MKVVNYLEEIMALRPKSDASAAIYESIAAIEAKARDYKMRAEVLQQKRSGSLLSMNTDALLGLDHEVTALGIAGEQAREMLAQLNLKLAERTREERIEQLLDGPNGRTVLIQKQKDFAARFNAFYAGMTEQYAMMKAEHDDLVSEAKNLNRQVEVCAQQSGMTPKDMAMRIPRIETHAVSVAYFDRVCLPVAGLDQTAVFYVDMIHRGKFWTAGDESGIHPVAAKIIAEHKLRSEQAEREGQEKRDAEVRRRQAIYGDLRHL